MGQVILSRPEDPVVVNAPGGNTSTLTSTTTINGDASQIFTLKAAMNILKDDLILISEDGRAVKGVTSDYAAQGTRGELVATTQVGLCQRRNKFPLLKDSDGYIYILTGGYQANSGLQIVKLNGGLVPDCDCDLSPDSSMGAIIDSKLFFLTNGNIAVVYATDASAGGNSMKGIGIVILRKDLSIVYPAVVNTAAYSTMQGVNNCDSDPAGTESGGTIARFYNVSVIGATPLANGGLMVVWQNSANLSLQKMVVLNSVGAVTTAVNTFATFGTSDVYWDLKLLSNGNVLATFMDYGAATSGFMVLNPAGATVIPKTNISTSASNHYGYPDSSVLPGYFCLAVEGDSGGHQVLNVNMYTNAGGVVGSAYSQQMGFEYRPLLVNDGDETFFVVAPFGYPNASGNEPYSIWKFPTNGADATRLDTDIPSQLGNASVQVACDVAYDGGRIVLVQGNGFTSQFSRYSVIDSLTGKASVTNQTFGASRATVGRMLSILPLGDFTFVAMYNQDDNGLVGTSSMNVEKFSTSAIVGVALNSATVGDDVLVTVSAGPHRINAVHGTTPKAFDHSASAIIGNQGTIVENAVILKGF